YPVAPARARNLGGDDQLVAPLASKPAAQKCLGAPLRGAVRRPRVHFRGIDEVDALGARVVELRVRLGLAVLLTPGHGTQTYLRDLEPGPGKRSKLHESLPSKGNARTRLYDGRRSALWQNGFFATLEITEGP